MPILNIDTRLLGGEVNESEFWLLTHIAKRIGKNRTCWPSNRTLIKDLGWGIEKLQKVKKSLSDKGFLDCIGRTNSAGRQTSNIYKVNIRWIGVFVSLEEIGALPEETEATGKTDTTDPALFPTPPPPLKTDNESLISNEVLIKEDNTTPQAATIFSREVIDWLNKVRKKYGIRGVIHWSKARHSAIEARRKESGADLPGLVIMFDHRCKSWKGTEFEKYLTPDTLFRASKFQGYMEQSAAQPAKDWTEQKSDDSNEEEDGGGVPAGHTW